MQEGERLVANRVVRTLYCSFVCCVLFDSVIRLTGDADMSGRRRGGGA